ncbi:MAG: hypothetical protein AWL62_2938, partial [Halanaerobium sp. T82-1]
VVNISESSTSHTSIFNWVQTEGAKLSKEADRIHFAP